MLQKNVKEPFLINPFNETVTKFNYNKNDFQVPFQIGPKFVEVPETLLSKNCLALPEKFLLKSLHNNSHHSNLVFDE